MPSRSKSVGHGEIVLKKGDITEESVDVIANAANSGLRGGGGVDGAIHRAAGSKLLKACRSLGRCPTGKAVLTPAFDLDAKYVAHAVGPRWRGGQNGESKLLSSAYKSCFELAAEKGCSTIALPSISTGVYGFPVEKASKIAMEEAENFLREARSVQTIIFVLFDDETYSHFEKALVE